MKNRKSFVLFGFIIVLFGFIFLINSSNQVPFSLKAQTKKEFPNVDFRKRNEAIIVKTLLHNSWLSISEIHKSSYKKLRKSLVSEIVNRIDISEKTLQKSSDYELSSVALLFRFLLESKSKSNTELKLMKLNDLKKTIVQVNSKQTKHLKSELKNYSIYKNLQIAYQWWLPKKNATLIHQINSIEGNKANFRVKDNYNRNTEVLRIIKVYEADYKYLGVYHSMVSRNGFEFYLAGSNDLKSWTRITSLGKRSHQGDIKKWGNGYVLVNENDVKEGSNNIQVRFYESYKKLCINQSEKNITLRRKFSRFAEGTPDIRKIEGENPEDSHLLLGYHYFYNGDVDYQAFGILKNFKDWKAWKDNITNRNIINMGFKGNIGGRYSFKRSNQSLILQEAQIKKSDFSKWRLLIGDGAFYTQLNLNTPKKSSSFANPSIVETEKDTFILSTFLPTEGNKRGENGQLVYTFKTTKD